jgi:hypothetical protein
MKKNDEIENENDLWANSRSTNIQELRSKSYNCFVDEVFTDFECAGKQNVSSSMVSWLPELTIFEL